MAILFESLPLNGLRTTHLEQLLWYINLQESTGTYYGNYEQFMKRQEELVELLDWAVTYSKEEGVKIPKRIKNE